MTGNKLARCADIGLPDSEKNAKPSAPPAARVAAGLAGARIVVASMARRRQPIGQLKGVQAGPGQAESHRNRAMALGVLERFGYSGVGRPRDLEPQRVMALQPAMVGVKAVEQICVCVEQLDFQTAVLCW